MNTETIEHTTTLTLPQRAAVALGTTTHEIKLRELLTNSAGILTVTNKAGRDECHAAYMVLKNARIGITNLSDEATEDAKLFTKAVKAEALRLLAITAAEEGRLQNLRDGFDAEEKARKEALIAAEMARTAKINHGMRTISEFGMDAAFARKTAAGTQASLDALESLEISEIIYQERLAEAEELKSTTLAQMREILTTRIAAETAEAQRLADIDAAAKQLAVDRAELDALRIEQKRIADENAAVAQRLADQQAALDRATKLQADQIAEAEQKAQTERERVAVDKKRQLEEQAAQHTAEKVVTPAPVAQAPDIARQQFYREPARPAAPLFDAIIDAGPTDEDIIAFGADHDMDLDELLPRLERFIADIRAGALADA